MCRGMRPLAGSQESSLIRMMFISVLAQLSQLGGETTIFKKFPPHSVSLFPKTLSNLAW